MNKHQQTYFTIVQNYLWVLDYPIEITDWSQVIQIASKQGTLALLADYALKLPDSCRPNTDQQILLRQSAMQNMMHQVKLKGYLHLVKECLDQANIPFILLKGYGLAALYPNPDVRQSGDVDIYIGQERFHEATRILRSVEGAVTYDSQDNDHDRHFNLHFENARYVVEVHRVTGDFTDNHENARYMELEKAEMGAETILVDGVEYRIPNLEFNVLYIFLHLWHHFLSEGIQIRQLIDWALVLHNAYNHQIAINYHQLESDLLLFHLMEPWQVFGRIVVENIGLPKDEMPFYSCICNDEQKHRLLEYLFEGNQRSYCVRTTQNYGWKHKMETLRLIYLNYRTTASVFPSFARHQLWSSIRYGINNTLNIE